MEAFISTLTYQDAAGIVGAFLGVSALAWGVGVIVRVLLNAR